MKVMDKPITRLSNHLRCEMNPPTLRRNPVRVQDEQQIPAGRCQIGFGRRLNFQCPGAYRGNHAFDATLRHVVSVRDRARPEQHYLADLGWCRGSDVEGASVIDRRRSSGDHRTQRVEVVWEKALVCSIDGWRIIVWRSATPENTSVLKQDERRR